MQIVDMLACGSVVCGRVGVWTWMYCMQMWMSRKERKKKKRKKTYFSVDDLLADVLHVDADE